MASWKDNLRPASFRGVEFFVDTSQYTGGRRVTFHEFPDRDLPFAEDLGKAGQTFKIDGYILGDDYFDTKQELIDAVNAEGSGELVHPYYGTLQVQCGAFSVDENKGEGRFAKLSFQFYEAGDSRFPQQVDDKQSQLEDSAAAAMATSKAAFDKKFSIINAPGFVVDSAKAGVGLAMSAVQAATKDVNTATSAVADLAFSIRNTIAAINDILKVPGKLSTHLQDALTLLQGAVNTPIGQFNANKTLFDFQNAVMSPFMTPARAQEATNNDSLNQFIKQQAVANATIAASLVTFDSVTDATNARNALQDQIELISLATDDDDVFQAFNDLHAQIVKTIPDADIQLPNVQELTIPVSTNSLCLIYDLYENEDGEDDLISRNKIKNPAFILGGSTLEVIDVRKSS